MGSRLVGHDQMAQMLCCFPMSSAAAADERWGTHGSGRLASLGRGSRGSCCPLLAARTKASCPEGSQMGHPLLCGSMRGGRSFPLFAR